MPATMGLGRRRILQCAGAGIAAAAYPVAGHAEPEISPVMTALSTYMARAGANALPDAVTEQAKLHILDTVGAMVSGSTLRPGKLAIAFARAYGGEKVATVVASNLACGPIEAALANAMLAHSDETDDSNAPSQSHPGASVVPATLAAGERFGIDGLRFLRAVTLGYDIGPRVTMTLGIHAFQDEGHKSTHAVAGAFGSAAAAGCTVGLNEQQMRWLLDYTAQQSAGIAAWQRDSDHIEKAFVFAGMAARNGVTGALLVQSGWTGVDDILSGTDNFLEAYGPGADPAGLTDQLGTRFEIARTNIKKWTVGSPIQAPLDALAMLMQQNHFHADDVREVDVRVATQEASVVNNRTIPDICLQHMIAVMLIDGTASFAAAHDVARMKDPAVLRQRAKVTLIPDEDLQRLLPRREATVEVLLQDGRRLSQHVDAVRGTAQNPMPRAEVVAKTTELITPVLGKAKCAALTEHILALEQVRDIRTLRPLLQLK
jgi:2-methylcitrate dehydratase PrpD